MVDSPLALQILTVQLCYGALSIQLCQHWVHPSKE